MGLVPAAGLALTAPINRQPAPPKQEIVIGALFSLTGNWNTLGRTGQEAFNQAADLINSKMKSGGDSLRIKVAVEDTKMDPELALAALKDLEKKGARIILGPQSSAEVLKIKPYADEHGLIIISPSSTAHALAISGDNIFRFCPDDVWEGRAVAALMWQDGVRNFISLGRYDAGNSGLMVSTNNAFAALGGRLIGGVRYGTDFEKDFAAELKYLEEKVRQAKPQFGGSLAIYAAGFDELAGFFDQAAAGHPALAEVPWYGSDGLAWSRELIKDKIAAEFAEKTGLPNPVFGLPDKYREKWLPVAQRIKAKTGLEPDAFALSVYDSAIVAALAILGADDQASAAGLRESLTAEAAAYVGITGPTALNEAGDRASGDFDFWAIRQGDWQKVAAYEAATGLVTKNDNYRPTETPATVAAAVPIETPMPAPIPELPREDDQASLLTQAQDRISQVLNKMDSDLAAAALKLSQTGLTGKKAVQILAQLIKDDPAAYDAITVDPTGLILAVEPKKYQKIVGKRIGDKEYLTKFWQTRQPVLSPAIDTVEGVRAHDLEQPVFDAKGKFLGSVSFLTKPSLWADILGPLSKDRPVRFMVMQPDGLILYETDGQNIGLNTFTDPAFKDHPELTDLARQMADRPAGSGQYTFLGEDGQQTVNKKTVWTSVGLHGTEFRLALSKQVE